MSHCRDLDRADSEQRYGADRRTRPTPVVSRFWLVGRRRGGRRIHESESIYVDRYTPAELALVLGVLALSVLDMFFTIQHLRAGGTEANPVMSWILSLGGQALFMGIKLASTVLGLFVLLVHVRFRKVRPLLVFALLLYTGILVFHLYLRSIA